MRDDDDLARPAAVFKQRLELSLRSRSHGDIALSSTVAQLTPARSSSTSL